MVTMMTAVTMVITVCHEMIHCNKLRDHWHLLLLLFHFIY